ncbi:MAG TPA: hypothetical protein VGK59_03550 [Ohtaekwangia sp.]
MKTLEEIKFHFENRSFFERMQFIDDYDFDDPFIEYYKDFIHKAVDVKHHLYLSDLIDLARQLKIFDHDLYKRYFGYLFQKRHGIVKLSCLDYMIACPFFYQDEHAEKRLKKLLNNSLRAIIQNQVYLALIALGTRNTEFYYKKFCESLASTKDWRSLHRVLNKVSTAKKLKPYNSRVHEYLKNLSDQQDLGPGISERLAKHFEANS